MARAANDELLHLEVQRALRESAATRGINPDAAVRAHDPWLELEEEERRRRRRAS